MMNKNTDNAWERFEQLAHDYDQRVEEIARQHPLQTEVPQHQHIAFWRWAAAAAVLLLAAGTWTLVAQPAPHGGISAGRQFVKASVEGADEMAFIRCNSQCDAQYIADETHQVL